MTKVKVLRSVEIAGVFLLLSGIILTFTGAEVLNIPFIRMDLVPFAVAFCGVLLFTGASSGISYEKTKTKEQQIEEKDERVIVMDQKSKAKSFDVMMISLPFGLLALALFGYLTTVSFFVIAGLFFLCFGYQKYLHLRYQREM